MFKNLQESGKDYPKNIGKLWSKDEEKLLLQEISENIDIEAIATKHERTIGGISSKINDIAYKMYIDNISIDKIFEKTKLDEKTIEEVIKKKKAKIKIGKNTDLFKIDNASNLKVIDRNNNSDIIEIKNDIKELKILMKKMNEMIKAIYQFENA